MKSNGLFAITEKEFNDHIYSRKFLLFLSIIVVVTIVGMAAGSVDYNRQIDDYNENLKVAEMDQESPSSWYKPSVMTIFIGAGAILASMGSILGIAMGFDLITREKESKSLKILLSHPIYRDEVINGKAAGGILALVLVIGITFVIAFGVMLIFGVVPSGEEYLYIALFGLAAFFMIFSYFAISMFMSTIAEDSGNALVYTLIIFVFLSSLLPVFVWGSTMDLVIGPAPEYPEGLEITSYGSGAFGISISGETEPGGTFDATEEMWQNYMTEMQDYWGKRQMVSGFVNLFSPTNNFQDIIDTLAGYGGGENLFDPGETGTGDILGKIFWNFVALIAIPAIFFGMAYVRFMRLDVR